MTRAISLVLTATLLALVAPAGRPRLVAKNDVVQTRWPNGVVRSEITYRDGAHEGAYRTWYQSGRPYELRHYRAGHEEGLQQAWSETGQLFINYEARDGRHFGLVNSTPCLPVTAAASGLPYYETATLTAQWTSVDHQIGAFNLTTQTGASISEQSLDGRIHVASFVYTHCAAVCPILINQLARVQRATQSMPDVTIVSYTVTPDTDTPNVLAAFGKGRGIDSSRWWLVTGNQQQIYRLARESYFADDERVGRTPDSAQDFLHTERVLLVDRQLRIRGVYNGTQPFDIDQLIADIRRLRPADK